MTDARREPVNMKWGVYDWRKEMSAVHVAPCDTQGFIAAGHVAHGCECQPRIEQLGDFALITHREES